MIYAGFSEVGPLSTEADAACRELKFNYFSIEGQLKYLQGRVLTLIEASITDLEQRKATKDIGKSLFSDAMVHAYNMATHPPQSSGGQSA